MRRRRRGRVRDGADGQGGRATGRGRVRGQQIVVRGGGGAVVAAYKEKVNKMNKWSGEVD